MNGDKMVNGAPHVTIINLPLRWQWPISTAAFSEPTYSPTVISKQYQTKTLDTTVLHVREGDLEPPAQKRAGLPWLGCEHITGLGCAGQPQTYSLLNFGRTVPFCLGARRRRHLPHNVKKRIRLLLYIQRGAVPDIVTY